ncbi:Proton-coupled zinc antiporter SLC30A9, mitochondrial [Plasmodiophora brassicae]|nr:hypothetical protein PBRA_005596 [Plasmodiophora brassicae]
MLVGICQRLVRPGSLGMSRCWRPCSRKANVGRPGPGPSMPSTIDDATGWIPRGAAIRRYCLDDADLDGLEHIEKPNPYLSSDTNLMRLYRHADIYAKAIQRYGSKEAVAAESAKQHQKLLEWVRANSSSASGDRGSIDIRYRPDQDGKPDRKLPARLGVWARTFAIGSTPTGKVVAAAIIGNASISLSKFAAFAFTGSASMLSEGIHSLADLSNQCLLAVGLSASNKTPDALHPYGYASEKYVWALISGVGIFFLGCGVSLYHGVLGILNPVHITYHALTPIVLAFSLFVESSTLVIAIREIRRAASALDMTTMQYIRAGPDPNTVAVVAEDAAAVCGIVIASSCIALTHWTGMPVFDAVGSVLVGGLLGTVAMFLIRKNHEFLLGRSIHPSYTDKVLRVLRESPIVSSVHDIKAVFLGPDAFRFKAEIVVNGQTLSRLFLASNAASLANVGHVHSGTVGFPFERNRADDHDADDDDEGHQAPPLPKSQAELEASLIEFGDHLIQFLGDEIDQIEAEIRRAVPEIKHVDLEII